MITTLNRNSFKISCDWPQCLEPNIPGDTAQAATELAIEKGYELQIKRIGNKKQKTFWFCSQHSKIGRQFDTEGKRVKVQKP